MDSNALWHIIQNELETIKKETDQSHHVILDKAFLSIKNSLENFLHEQVIAGHPHPHPRSRIYRCEPKLWNIRESRADEILQLILEQKKNCTKPPACVFDLDGTLFDVGYRTLGIIKEWINSENSKNFNESLIKKMAKIDYQHVGYSLSHAFENAGFDLRNQEILSLFTQIEIHWRKKFFDGKSLLRYDILIEKSDEFVKKIHQNGIEVFYLTGRHHHFMAQGTQEQLAIHDFPLHKTNLILKKNPFLEDQIFKSEEIKNITKTHNIIGNFENEYLNLAFMALEAPAAVHVIIDSQHSGRPTPELNVPIYRITHFI